MDVSQTATVLDRNSDGVNNPGDEIRYNIVIVNSGNSTITGLDFATVFDGGSGAPTLLVPTYIPSPNNRSDGFISPGGQAASLKFTQLPI